MLGEAGVKHDIKVYPDAGHGFLNDHDSAELPIWVKALAKIVAADFHEPSARQARRRIIDFFDARLVLSPMQTEYVESAPHHGG